MTPRIHSHAWSCDLPGCRSNGAGYPSESRAVRAQRRHMERAHRGVLARLDGIGGAL